LAACDHALQATLTLLAPRYAVGIGGFAAQRVAITARGMAVVTGRITHPSPANPKANRGWNTIVEQEFRDMGIDL
jgi:single-strand selective monofunctional uracil DNA glycosylase